MAQRKPGSTNGENKSLKERVSADALEEQLKANMRRRTEEKQAGQLAVEKVEFVDLCLRNQDNEVSRRQRRAEKRQRNKLMARKFRLLE